MANDSSFSYLLEDSFSDHDKSVEDFSIALKDALLTLTERYDADPLQLALQQSLSSCPDDSLEEKIFNEVLPFAHGLLTGVLKQIIETMNVNRDGNSLEGLKQRLLLCHQLLTVWERSMDRVSKLCKTTAVKLKCIVENALLTIQLIFEHCRTSKTVYGALFGDVSIELTNLFRKAKSILNLFLATLENVIVFDTDKESETELLVKVIDFMGLFVTIAHELDLKTFVETSKVFGKLAIVHQTTVKQTNADSVALHLAQMTRDISSMLAFCQDPSEQIEERKIKVIGHSLKIMDRLFAAYCACINDEFLLFLIELLSKMHRCHPTCLQNTHIDDKLIELIHLHISRGAEPILNTIFKTTNFKQTFFEYNHRENIDKLSYHLLTISIMKKLLNMPLEQQSKWTLGAESIIDVALTNINYLQEEICMGQVKLPGVHDNGERPRSATLYESTLVPICVLIAHIPADGFHAIELILLKHLFSNQLWSSLMSSDIWCFIGRIGSPELCASHIKYFLKVYNALTRRGNSLEIVMLKNLIGRLYNLLSEEMKHTLVTQLEESKEPYLIALSKFLPSKTKTFLQNRLSSMLNEIPEKFAELQRQPTVENWNAIITLISLIGKSDYTAEKEVINVLSQLWTNVANTIEIFDGRQLDILSEFVTSLFDATQPEKVQDDTLQHILEAVLSSFLCFPSHVKVIVAHYLRNNTHCFGNCGIKSACSLAELNCRLLEDENPWVRQEALESFDYLAHMCPNEELVTKMAITITKRPSLADFLPAYLSGTNYYKLQDFTSVQDYLQHVVKHFRNDCHVCNDYDDSQKDEKCVKLATQSVETANECTNEFDGHVNRICDELNDILRKNNNLGDRVLRRLRSICTKILDSTEDK